MPLVFGIAKKKLVSSDRTSSSSCHERFEGLFGRVIDEDEEDAELKELCDEKGCVKASGWRGNAFGGRVLEVALP
jgi:hypothetical protein